MSKQSRADNWAYLLKYENDTVTVLKTDGTKSHGYVELVDDAETFDRAEPSLTLWHDGTIELIFANDIQTIYRA